MQLFAFLCTGMIALASGIFREFLAVLVKRLTAKSSRVNWRRKQDLNQRPTSYGPDPMPITFQQKQELNSVGQKFCSQQLPKKNKERQALLFDAKKSKHKPDRSFVFRSGRTIYSQSSTQITDLFAVTARPNQTAKTN